MATSENTASVTTRVTPSVKAALQAEAHALGLTDAAYIRVILLGRRREYTECQLSAPLNINTTEQEENR